MQSKRPADRAPTPTPTPGRGEDQGHRPHVGTTPASQPPREDDRSGADLPGADPPESEQCFRATFERAVIGIAYLSPEGRLLRVNQRLCDLLGYRHEELAALTWQDLTHPDDLDAASTQARRLLAGEIDEYELDQRYLRKDGTPVWVHLTVALVRTPEGEPDYFIAMVQDITERTCLEREREAALARATATEAEAAERAERLRTILETMADGVAVYDANGRPLQMNRAYRELFALEYGPVEYEGLTTCERARLVQLRDAATGALLPFEESPVGRALGGEVVTGPDADIRARAFDGRELELNSSAAPLREPDGRVAGVVLVLRDMGERNQLAREREAALARAERQAEQLDCIFEAAADGLLVFDLQGRIVRENPATRRIFGLDAAPPGFRQLSLCERLALFAPRDEQGRPVAVEELPLMRVLRGEVVAGQEVRDIRMRALDGREIELNFAAAPLHDREGHLAGVVLVLHDMTERNRLEREREAAHADELAAHEASRRMEQFLAVAAHDLRAPLTAVVGFLDLAERQAERLAAAAQEGESLALTPAVATLRDRLEEADRGAARLTRLLTRLFDTAAIRADRLELHRAPCDLAALVRDQMEALRVAAPGRDIRLHLPQDCAAVPVEVDADRIGQVVANYLTNALKYSPTDRPVEVSVAVRVDGGEGQARVAVRDRGPGIPVAERARVWELFHRAPGIAAQGGAQAGAPGSGSLGLGLHISKAIVEAHGGRVGVASTVGAGSTFWFTLPLSGPLLKPTGAGAVP